MNPDTHEQHNFDLLAAGVSGAWSVDLDESTDGTAWALQLDGPHVYLAFEVRDLAAIRSAAEYLRAHRTGEPVALGCFASQSVTLHWDDEFPDRCFLIVGPSDRASMRLTLSAEDAESLGDALGQIAEELSVKS